MSTKAVIFINYIIVIIICINLTFDGIAEIVESDTLPNAIFSGIITFFVLFYGAENFAHVVKRLNKINKKD